MDMVSKNNILKPTNDFVLTHFISQTLLFSAVALQCCPRTILKPATPGVTMPPVKLETCPPEARRCANTETVAEIAIPNQSLIKSMIKAGQCANEEICGGTLNCDNARQSTPGFKSCKVTINV